MDPGRAVIPARPFFARGLINNSESALTKDDVARYRARAAAELSPGLNDWLEHGRKGSDPKTATD
jgi:hypothetical protein